MAGHAPTFAPGGRDAQPDPLLLLAAPVIAVAKPASVELVERALSGTEDLPSPDDLRTLGDDVDAALIAIASEVSKTPYLRMRAVGYLGWFPSDRTLAFLGAWARRRDLPPSLLAAVPAAYARAYGRQLGDELVRQVMPLLSHPNPTVRSGAVAGLALVRTRAALDALRARLRVEADEGVREDIAEALVPPRPVDAGGPHRERVR